MAHHIFFHYPFGAFNVVEQPQNKVAHVLACLWRNSYTQSFPHQPPVLLIPEVQKTNNAACPKMSKPPRPEEFLRVENVLKLETPSKTSQNISFFIKALPPQ